MAKFRNFCFNRFSGSKLPQKLVLAISTRCLIPEICILCHFGVKMGLKHPKMEKFRIFFFQRFSGLKLPQKMVLAIFTRCLVPELCILCHFAVKSAFLGLNSSRTKEITAKPMVLSYVGYFSKH